MNVKRLLYWFQRHGKSKKVDEVSRAIEAAVELKARQLQMIDPETQVRWNSMRIELERRQNTEKSNRAVIDKVLRKPVISFALAVALLAAVGVFWLQKSSIKIYETSKGQHATVLLQDSTEVILNSLSELSVNRKTMNQVRQVSLKGEALFHVRKNGTPFILSTDLGTVQVLGTEFNVRVRNDRMEVAVLSGCVKMSVKRNGVDSSIILTKGQIAFCSKRDFPDVPGNLPFADYPGWVDGKLMFYRSPLSIVCTELETYYDIKIRVENLRLSSATVTGVIKNQNAESAIKTLLQLTGTTVRYENGVYNIY
jgi:transmembrane sensor